MTAAYPAQARHGQVVHGLGAQIVRGELGPGCPVPTEDELVSQFEVGRSALREGVKVLAGKGLLESRTSAGTRVRPRESWNLLDPDVLRWRYAPDASPADIRKSYLKEMDAMRARMRLACDRTGSHYVLANTGHSLAETLSGYLVFRHKVCAR